MIFSVLGYTFMLNSVTGSLVMALLLGAYGFQAGKHCRGSSLIWIYSTCKCYFPSVTGKRIKGNEWTCNGAMEVAAKNVFASLANKGLL